jgi:magnesium-transporting ATPase (P-type)
MAFLAVNIVVQLAAIVSTFMHIDLLYKIMEETRGVARAQRQAGEGREAVMRIVQLAAFIASAVAFLIWLHRAYKNLKPLGVEPRYSPAWVVGAFIIPIVNLFLPFQIVQEMWRASDPETIAVSGAKSVTAFIEDSSKSLLVVVWWGLWLLTIINLVIAYRWHVIWQILNEEIIASWLIIMLSLLLIIDSIVTIVLVKKITDRQDEKNRRLAELAAPPGNVSTP